MFHRDLTDLLSFFDAHHVRYLIVGGYAVSFYAQPRATKDLDVFIKQDAGNASAILEALSEFGAPLHDLTLEDLQNPNLVFRIGSPPIMVDILPKIDGVDFDHAWLNRVLVVIDPETGFAAPFISMKDLLAGKLASGRPQDLADAAALREAAQLKTQPTED